MEEERKKDSLIAGSYEGSICKEKDMGEVLKRLLLAYVISFNTLVCILSLFPIWFLSFWYKSI